MILLKSVPRLTIKQLPTELVSGLVAGILSVVTSISFGALIFAGERLSPFVFSGIGIALFSTMTIAAVVALTSPYPATIAGPHNRTSPVLAFIAAGVAADMPASASGEQTFLTAVAAIILTSLVTGVALFVLGTFKLGRLARFLPYPVIGGLIAGTGWLLIRGSTNVMVGFPLDLARLPELVADGTWIKWVPGLAFALLLLIVSRRPGSSFAMPALLFGSIGLYHLVLWMSGVSIPEAQTRGLLLGSLPEGQLWRLLTVSALTQAHWPAIFRQAASILTVLALSIISIPLNVSAFELTARRDLDLNRELWGSGLANLACGLTGGLVGFHSLSITALAHKIGGRTRLVGLAAAALTGVVLLFGAYILPLFPRSILGGLLLFLGLSFVVEWVYDAWFSLPLTDYLVVLFILVVSGFIGFFESVGVGLIAAIVMFVVNYSRINVVQHMLSGAAYSSNVDRPPHHRRLLREQGEQTLIFKLQGFIFFGTANTVLELIRQRVANRDLPTLRFVVFSFHRVTGVDSSAVLAFVKMQQLASAQGLSLIFTHLSPAVARQLERGGIADGTEGIIRVYGDLDHSIEWCENRLLETASLDQDKPSLALGELLAEGFPTSAALIRLLTYLEREQVGAGYYLMRQGDPASELYFIESGNVTAELELEDGERVRLRTMGPGTVVGEMGLYLHEPRTAFIQTETPAVVYKLTFEALRRMEQEDPDLAIAFHQFLARSLAERLRDRNYTLEALLR